MAARYSDSGPGSSLAAHADVQTLECDQRELIAKVRSLRQELADWHAPAGQQVTSYTTQLTDIQTQLLEEMSSLKSEVLEMKNKVRAALEVRNAPAAVAPFTEDTLNTLTKDAAQGSGYKEVQRPEIIINGIHTGMGNENEGPTGCSERAGAAARGPI